MATALKRRRVATYEGVTCPFCGTRLPMNSLQDGEQSCRQCRRSFDGIVFNPPVRKTRVKHIAETGVAGSAVCARHERNAAAANCQRCGDFMCNLCRIDADSMMLCPPCFERLSDEGALPSSIKSFKNYSGMAGSMAAAGLLIWFASPILGPLAIFYAVKGFKQKRETGERDGVLTLWLALLLGVLDIAIGVLIFAAIFGAFRKW